MRTRNGRKYLKTDSDGIEHNNLLALLTVLRASGARAFGRLPSGLWIGRGLQQAAQNLVAVILVSVFGGI
ncbi:DUF3892 domain-containing protein [Mesorhizobium sp. Cs1299R1N3]